VRSLEELRRDAPPESTGFACKRDGCAFVHWEPKRPEPKDLTELVLVVRAYENRITRILGEHTASHESGIEA
jgi:hypothetical protein